MEELGVYCCLWFAVAAFFSCP